MSNVRTINFSVASLPSWVPPPGVLKSIPSPTGVNGTLIEVRQPLTFGGPLLDFQRAINAWSTGLVLPEVGPYGICVFSNGGHQDWPGTDYYSWAPEDRFWRILRPASPVLLTFADPAPWNSFGEYPDGSPGTSHMWDGLIGVPPSAGYPKGRIVVLGRYGQGLGANYTYHDAHELDVQTGQWQRSTNSTPDLDDAVTGGVYDPIRNGIWKFGSRNFSNRVRFYDLTTHTFGPLITLGGDSVGYLSFDVVSTWCPKFGGALTRVSAGTRTDVYYFDPNTLTRTAITMTGPGPQPNIPANTNQHTGIEWCEDTDKAYCYRAGESRVWRLTPPTANPKTATWTWDIETFSGSSDAPSYVFQADENTTNKRFNRWRYNKKIKCFMWHEDITRPLQVYRPVGT